MLACSSSALFHSMSVDILHTFIVYDIYSKISFFIEFLLEWCKSKIQAKRIQKSHYYKIRLFFCCCYWSLLLFRVRLSIVKTIFDISQHTRSLGLLLSLSLLLPISQIHLFSHLLSLAFLVVILISVGQTHIYNVNQIIKVIRNWMWHDTEKSEIHNKFVSTLLRYIKRNES